MDAKTGREINFGEINGPIVGIFMKEMVRRAIETIRAYRQVFEAEAKGVDDFVTNADKAAQRGYVKPLREAFPLFGLIGEEDNLSLPCLHPWHDVCFTVDPLDGTKAFIRKQSHGVGTMIALVCDGEVVAAYVGDIMTQEIYGFRPGSEKVHRIGSFGRPERLVINEEKTFASQFLLLREDPDDYSVHARKLFEKIDGKKACKGIEITSGSIGVSFARLWKSEVAATLLAPGKQTPWDMAPIFGISKKLGFVFMKVDPTTGELSEWDWIPGRETVQTDFELLVLHQSRLAELREKGFKIAN